MSEISHFFISGGCKSSEYAFFFKKKTTKKMGMGDMKERTAFMRVTTWTARKAVCVAGLRAAH